MADSLIDSTWNNENNNLLTVWLKCKLAWTSDLSPGLMGFTVAEPMVTLPDDGRVWGTRGAPPLLIGSSERENWVGQDPRSGQAEHLLWGFTVFYQPHLLRVLPRLSNVVILGFMFHESVISWIFMSECCYTGDKLTLDLSLCVCGEHLDLNLCDTEESRHFAVVAIYPLSLCFCLSHWLPSEYMRCLCISVRGKKGFRKF